MLHAYCILRAADPPPPPGTVGVDGEPVRRLDAGDLAAWVSSAAPGPPTLARIREHDGVTRVALGLATPVPVRYGAGAFQDADHAHASLAESRERLAAALARVAGRVEMGVRVGWPGGEPPDPGRAAPAPAVRSGREYLEARRADLAGRAHVRAAADALLDEIDAIRERLDLATVRTLMPDPETAGTLAHLVRSDDLDRYRAALRRCREARPERSLTLTGPWAPYSFV